MADTKTSLLAALTGAGVDAAADLLYIVDTSAGAAGSKYITVAELLIGMNGARLAAANSFTTAQTITPLTDVVALTARRNTAGATYIAQFQTEGNAFLAAIGNAGELLQAGSTSGTSTIKPPAEAGSAVITLPGVTGTLALLGANIFTGEQSFNSTTIGGMRLNNLTTTQRDAIASPLAGMVIWNTTTAQVEQYSGAAWEAVGGAGGATLGANTFTALQTIAQAAANAGILASTGYSLTGADATSMLDFAGTLNTTGNPVLFKLGVTNTASGATTKFMSLLAGAGGVTEIAAILKGGQFQSTALAATSPTYSFIGDTNTGVTSLAGDNLHLVCGGTASMSIATSEVNVFGGTAAPTQLNLNNNCALAFGLAGTKQIYALQPSAATNVIGWGTTNALTTGIAQQMTEMTAPAAGAANTVRIYAEDNGAGKTRLMALFNTGAAQQIAIEP